jgi:hypothetical protein
LPGKSSAHFIRSGWQNNPYRHRLKPGRPALAPSGRTGGIDQALDRLRLAQFRKGRYLDWTLGKVAFPGAQYLVDIALALYFILEVRLAEVFLKAVNWVEGGQIR